jgi:hypothetical protein
VFYVIYLALVVPQLSGALDGQDGEGPRVAPRTAHGPPAD